MLITKLGEKGPDILDGKSVASSHCSDSTFDFISESIRTCLNSHKNCPRNIDVLLPTFVLDVGLEHSGLEPRLVESDGTSIGTYLTLSYCWGGPQDVQLTTKSKETYKRGIPLSSLPATLRDAISVTQRLGQRFIWIDALCIVQDDEASKQNELAQMCRIYTNSFLTIQVSMASSVNQGFLESRNPPAVQPLKFSFQKHCDGPQTHVYIRLRHEENRETPISSRAWTFQETALPARMLIYTRLQAIMVCREKVFREDGMRHAIGSISPLNYRNIQPGPGGGGGGSATSTRESVLSSWYWHIGTFYSKRAHSVSDDRLNALSAYAETAHQAIGGRYLAGVWEVDLIRGLEWRRVVRPLKRAPAYRAPSWSWAAYDGEFSYAETSMSPARIRFNEKHGPKNPDPLFSPSIIDSWTTKTGISEFGACHDGKIVIETLVGLVTVTALDESHDSRFRAPRGGVQLQTMEGAKNICAGFLDTDSDVLVTVLCASLTGISGLLLVESASSRSVKEFRRVGTYKLTTDYNADDFGAWRQSCRREILALV